METGNNQIKTIHNIVDEAFNSSSALSYHLSIQLGLDGLSFCILDIKNNKFLVLKSFKFNKIFTWEQLAQTLESTFKLEDLLKNQYKSVSFLINHNQFTIVPDPLFDTNNQKDYLKLNATFDNSYSINNDVLKSIDARNVFAIPQGVEKIIRHYFRDCKIMHHTSSLIESFINKNKNSNENQLFVNINASAFDLILIAGNKLICCNTFNFYSNEDFVYYVLFVCEQFKLNPEKINLILSGDIEKNSENYSSIFNYIRNISLITRNESFSYSYKFDEIPGHFYYNLLNQFTS
ncbi:MAG: DUF3822 family protein [Bacteroidota bacterium]|nr:DUF3822 family protein [Bacteroidota bacterium]